MISYMHFPLVIISLFVILSVWRFWYCMSRLGFIREVGRRAPELAQGDILAVTFCAQPLFMAVINWFQIILPDQVEPLPSVLTVFLSISGLCGCLYILRNSKQRIAGSWAGTRESVLRTVAALRIIDAAELAYALDVNQKYSD